MKIWNKILEKIQSFKRIHSLMHQTIDSAHKPVFVQENSRDSETKKRVSKEFESQKEQMNARALKAHDSSCLDVVNCKKLKCFKRIPDKIVSTSNLSNEEINKELKRRKDRKLRMSIQSSSSHEKTKNS